MALIDKLTNIANAIRGKTGGTDPLTLDSMVEAIAAIETGGGGSDGGTSGIYMAKVTPASDMENLQITHNLGTTDILVAVCWAETLGDVTPAFDGAVANVYLKSSLPFRLTNSANHENMIAYAKWSVSNANVATVGQPNSYAYFPEAVNENTFVFKRASASLANWMAGVTYTVIIMAASAFKETEG